MSVTEGHFQLTENQKRFKALLQQFPRLAGYWDFQKRQCDLEAIEEVRGVLSHGERLMVEFLVNVWLGTDHYKTELIDLVSVLDDEHLSIVTSWKKEPFYP